MCAHKKRKQIKLGEAQQEKSNKKRCDQEHYLVGVKDRSLDLVVTIVFENCVYCGTSAALQNG